MLVTDGVPIAVVEPPMPEGPLTEIEPPPEQGSPVIGLRDPEPLPAAVEPGRVPLLRGETGGSGICGSVNGVDGFCTRMNGEFAARSTKGWSKPGGVMPKARALPGSASPEAAALPAETTTAIKRLPAGADHRLRDFAMSASSRCARRYSSPGALSHPRTCCCIAASYSQT